MRSTAATTATFCATLIDEWLRCGVKHAVICPGSRSTPLAIALSDRPEFEVHLFHDERSAAFAALGIGKALGIPAILVCTSGTAAVEFHAAVVEADHAEVPILVCTADRPPELQNVGAPQTINQKNLYGGSVRLFVNADVADDREHKHWRAIARDTWRACVGENLSRSFGPVHINFEFREPLVGVANELPKVKSSRESKSNVRRIGILKKRKIINLLKNRRVLLIAGAGSTNSASELIHLAETMCWPVLSDPRSGTRVEGSQVVISAMDAMLRDQHFSDSQQPDVILRFGTPLVSKVVNNWLASSDASQIVVTNSQSLIDPERITSLHLVADIKTLSDLILSKCVSDDKSWLQSWSSAEAKAQQSIDKTLADENILTEPAVARALYRSMPGQSNLFVSSSMPIRDIEWFAAPRSGLQIYANRGVNGIDGVVSTAVGVALASKCTTFLLIGDLAFLHDSNGLIDLMSRNIDLRIVLIDNCGGGIFSFLPQATEMDSTKFEKFFGTPHNADLVLIAKAHGLEATTITSLDQFIHEISNTGSRLIRVVTDRSENVRVHDRINQMVSLAIQNT